MVRIGANIEWLWLPTPNLPERYAIKFASEYLRIVEYTRKDAARQTISWRVAVGLI
jgi:hypothetical protein